MGREVRMVPPDWQHPTRWRKNWQTGKPRLVFAPLLDGDYETAAAEWREEKAQWDNGFIRDWSAAGGWKPKPADFTDDDFDAWYGDCPDQDSYMPKFTPGSATHLMMYETTSEGTPISPAFATAEELARWLAENGASTFGNSTGTYEQWLRVCRGGWAPSAVHDAAGFRSGVEAMGDFVKSD